MGGCEDLTGVLVLEVPFPRGWGSAAGLSAFCARRTGFACYLSFSSICDTYQRLFDIVLDRNHPQWLRGGGG